MPGRTFEVAPGITAIDTGMGGRPMVTASYLIHAERPALIESGPSSCGPTLVEQLAALGIGPHDLAHIVVSHIHLDHAGGAGRLLRSFPGATVWVHERGARHLADPERLVASTIRTYGAQKVAELFGAVDPVPPEHLRPLNEGAVIDLGDRSILALDAPGHASHELFLVDSASGALFTGDGFGVSLPDVGVLRPATPPPEFDLGLAVASIRRVRDLRPSTVVFSHFGAADDVEATCDLAIERLQAWTGTVGDALARGVAPGAIPEVLRAATAAETRAALAAGLDIGRYEFLSSYEMNAAGIVRYLAKGGGTTG
jgi:glyoxylase-like metal-dependent hydrolase (beta-lactamase superfamily II)